MKQDWCAAAYVKQDWCVAIYVKQDWCAAVYVKQDGCAAVYVKLNTDKTKCTFITFTYHLVRKWSQQTLHEISCTTMMGPIRRSTTLVNFN